MSPSRTSMAQGPESRVLVPSADLTRVSLVLFLRGCLLVLLAALAVRWPEETLLTTVVTAGEVVGMLGVFELALALVSTAPRSTRALLVAHALLSVVFGAVAVSVRLVSAQTMVILVALWMLLHAALALALIGLVSHVPRARVALMAWAAVNVLCAFVAASYTGTTLELLYVGALYAFAYGVVQMAAGLWIRRHHGVIDAPSS